MKWLALLALLVGCEPPTPPLLLQFSENCPSTACEELPLTCDAWVSIRIIDPLVPQTAYLSECKPVRRLQTQDNLCALGGVEFEQRELPLRTLEVQVAVVPPSSIMSGEDGQPVCPTNIQYDVVNGFPITGAALGGRTYYHPGDSEIGITLGCTDLKLVENETCVGASTVEVNALVDDFETRVTVSQPVADQLTLAVGKPRADGGELVLEPMDVTELVREPQSSPPAWSIHSGLFDHFVCLTVFERVPQSTETVTCKTTSLIEPTVDFESTPGVRLTKATLDDVLDAVELTEFPLEGLTIGIVVDVNGNPRSGITVETEPTVEGAPAPTIQYLSSDRTSIGGTSTSLSAIFVSTDAPFGTEFKAETTTTPMLTAKAIGGRIARKVTIVVLQFQDPIIGGD